MTLSGISSVTSTSEFIIYPNPNNGEFNIQFTGNAHSFGQIEIYNMLGTKVFEKNVSASSGIEKLALKNISRGLYICRFISGDRSTNKYFVKL